ncbi:MAG TPA: hypothetical protein DCL54_08915 [Alphaproteobacteria bacterium]|nr:hypothetical protein [Alphaproteobacteria bacterium]
MIGKLSGVVDAIDGERVLIDVNGVGYIAHCSARTLAQLPAPGGRATLIIETQMTQEQIKLFGFGPIATAGTSRALVPRQSQTV